MPSPYMLFTAEVRGDKLPAITPVDGSSRIQTVDESCGGVRRILEECDRETGIPVLINTSFNGPGEPIVDTPAEAIAFLMNSEIDVVYIEGRRITLLFLKTAQGLVDISLRFANLHGLGDGVDALQDAILQRHALPVPHQRLLGTNTDRTIREDCLD